MGKRIYTYYWIYQVKNVMSLKKLHLSLRLALLSKTETSLAQNFSIW